MATTPTVPTPDPRNAREAVMLTRDDHSWARRDLDLHSTDGVQRNIRALWAAIDRLAAYVDGVVTPVEPDTADGHRPNSIDPAPDSPAPSNL